MSHPKFLGNLSSIEKMPKPETIQIQRPSKNGAGITQSRLIAHRVR